MGEQETPNAAHRAESLFFQYLEERERGEEPDLDRLCEADPSLAPALRALVREFSSLERALHPGTQTEFAGPSPPPASRSLPRQLDGYVIRHELGRGGMGVVYEAIEILTGRRVALKLLPAELSRDAERRERFEREARLAASVADPRCVAVFGTINTAEGPGIVMELVFGEDLQQRVRRKTVPVHTAVTWTIDILSGLEALHRAGAIHRDVKPSNCFLTERGDVKVGDFGLARALVPDDPRLARRYFAGSPGFAAPEQISASHVDRRADIYGAAATLHALLTGRPPNPAIDVDALAEREQRPPQSRVSSLGPEVPVGLENVLAKALSFQPGSRHRSCREFATALHPFAVVARWAPLSRRIQAYVLDLLVLGAVCGFVAKWILRMVRRDFLDSDLALQLAAVFGVALNLLYFVVTEGFEERSIGKRLLDLRIVPDSQVRSELRARCVRAVLFTLVPSVIAAVVTLALFSVGVDASRRIPVLLMSLGPMLAPVVGVASALYFASPWYLLALLAPLAPFAVGRRGRWSDGLHGWISGTRVAWESEGPPDKILTRLLLPGGAFSSADSSDLPSCVGPYEVVSKIGDGPDGPWLIVKDPKLHRDVLLQRLGASGAESSPCELDAPGQASLRLLAERRTGDRYRVFEYPGGGPICGSERPRRSLGWSRLAKRLDRFAFEIEETGAPRFLEQIWMEPDGTLRVVPVPIGIGPFQDIPVGRLFRAIARLLGAGAERSRANVPAYADPAHLRLIGDGPPFSDLGEIRRALAGLRGRSTDVSRNRRFWQWQLMYLEAAMVGGAWLFAGAAMAGQRWSTSIAAAPTTVAFLCTIWIPLTILAVWLRGGVSFALVGLDVRNRNGALASRKTHFIRALIAYCPANLWVAALLWGTSLRKTHPTIATTLFIIGSAVALIYVCHGVAGYMSRLRKRSLVDLLLGTSIVLR